MKFTDTFIYFVLDDLRNFAEANKMVQLEKTLYQLLRDQRLQHSIVEDPQRRESSMVGQMSQQADSALVN